MFTKMGIFFHRTSYIYAQGWGIVQGDYPRIILERGKPFFDIRLDLKKNNIGMDE